jgi:murein DD-endopeptidase MepM/ murein hydrolase activator NlpD
MTLRTFIIISFVGALFGISIPGICAAALKLPYAAGETFVVAQGYHTSPTHLGKDDDALDFAQDGCDAYGRAVVAAAAGKVIFSSQAGYNGGYGSEVIMSFASGTQVMRYAHLIPGSIVVAPGASVAQGQRIGAVGNTGLVEGGACSVHPGTHLHFAVYDVTARGGYRARIPEPISGNTGIVAGAWYRSDNGFPAIHDEDAYGAPDAAPKLPIASLSPHPSLIDPSSSLSSPSSSSLSSSPSLSSSLSASSEASDTEYCPE